MELTYTRQTHIADDYADDVPDHVVIKLNQKLIKRILQLNSMVKKLKVWMISEFDYTPEYMVHASDENTTDGSTEPEELEEWEGSIDGLVLGVSDNSFSWNGVIKHTSVSVETDSILIEELRENLSIYDTPRKDLPLLIGKKFKYETTGILLDKVMRKK